MVVSPSSSQRKFKIIVRKLRDSLQKCSEDPSFFFEAETFSFLDFPTTSPETKTSLNWCLSGDGKGEVMAAISKGFLAAVNAQLADYLSDQEGADMKEGPLTN